MKKSPTSESPVNTRARVRRDEILDVAASLFERLGYNGTTLEEVAARIGVTRPALYYYFRSKDDILAAVYDRAVGVLLDRATELLSAGGSPIALLHRLMELHVQLMLEDRTVVAVFLRERMHLPPNALETVQEKERAFGRLLVSLIKRGQSEGALVDGDPVIIANSILGMLISLHQWYRPRMTFEQLTHTFWAITCCGVIRPSSSWTEDSPGPSAGSRS